MHINTNYEDGVTQFNYIYSLLSLYTYINIQLFFRHGLTIINLVDADKPLAGMRADQSGCGTLEL